VNSYQVSIVTKIAKVLIFIFALSYMAYKINSQTFDLGKLSNVQFFQSNYLFVALLLLPLNWSLEAIKWQNLILKIEKISFKSSLIAILTGLSLSFFTPFNIGTYLGRVWQLQSKKRYEVFGSLLLSSFLQSIFTFGFGAIAVLIYLPNQYWQLNSKYTFTLLFVGILILFLAIYFIKKHPKYYRFVSILEKYTVKEITYLLAISGLRYLVFCTQFVLVLLAWKVNLKLSVLFTSVSMSFALKSSLPTLNFLSDLGIRESAAVYTFGFYTAELESVLMASLSLWLINIVLPSLVGSFFLYKAKLKN
jgi:hypothetical protein